MPFVQGRGISSTGAVASLSLAFVSPVVAGNTLVVAVMSDGGAAEDQSVWSDNRSDVFVQGASADPASQPKINISIVKSAVGGSTTVTFTPSSGSVFCGIAIAEFSGLPYAVVTDTADNKTAADASPDTGPITSLVGGVLFAAIDRSFAGDPLDEDTGWTRLFKDSSWVSIAGNVMPSGGTVTPSWSSVAFGTNWMAAIALSAGHPPGPDPVFVNTSLTTGLTWMIVTTRSGTQYVWSDRPLPDPASYYLGWKEPRVMQWGAIRRALSGFDGQYETSDFTVTLSDTDRLLRQLDADAQLVNATVAVYMIDDPGRRLLSKAKTVYRGVIRDAKPQGTLAYGLVIKDTFAEQFSATNTTNLLPRRMVNSTDFAHCAIDAVSSSAEGYLVNGTVASGSTDVPVRSGHGVFAEGDKVVLGGVTYAITAPSSFMRAGVDVETYISVDPALTGGLSDGNTVTPVPSHQVTPSAGVRVPFVYGSITDRSLSGSPSIDAGDGQGPMIYVGDKVLSDGKTYGEFLWAGHACYSPSGRPFSMLYFWNEALDDLVAGYPDLGDLATAAGSGGRIAMPGYDLWDDLGFTDPFVDYGGRRYCVLYMRGIFRDWALGITNAPANLGGIPFTVNAYGIEDVGDGSGALIRRGLQQYKHIVLNWCPPKGVGYQSGAWLTAPTFPDDPGLSMIDETSFDNADAQSGIYVTDGFQGDFIVGVNNEAITARELIARLNLSFGVESGFNRATQFFVSMVNTDIGSTTLQPTLTFVRDIFAGTFQIDSATRELYTALDYRHTQDYLKRAADGWRSVTTGITEIENTSATTVYGSKTVSPQLNLYMLRGKNRDSDADDYIDGSLTIAAVLALKLARASSIQHLPKLQTGPAGFNYELADVVPITHYEGLSSTGWTERPIRIERTETDPSQFVEAIEGYDLDPML